MMAAHLARAHCTRSRPLRVSPVKPISGWKNLESDLSLHALAAEVEISPLYLARAFRAAAGQSPHQYVLTRRIERARELLRTTDMPVVDVALASSLSRMDWPGLGDSVLASEGLYPGLHDGTGLHGAAATGIRQPELQGDRAQRGSGEQSWKVGRRYRRDQGSKVEYPMIGDPELKIAKLYDMLPAEAGNTSEGRTAATNATVRTVFVIGPDKKIKLMLSYPMSTGRNFDEVLRVLDSIQLTANHKVATPVNWKHGDDVIILPSVSDEEAKQKYPGGWTAPKPYLRIVPQPK